MSLIWTSIKRSSDMGAFVCNVAVHAACTLTLHVTIVLLAQAHNSHLRLYLALVWFIPTLYRT